MFISKMIVQNQCVYPFTRNRKIVLESKKYSFIQGNIFGEDKIQAEMHSFFFYIKQSASGPNRILLVVYSGALFKIISVFPHVKKKLILDSIPTGFQIVNASRVQGISRTISEKN